jgi:uncharacterized protein (DUF1330 family)
MMSATMVVHMEILDSAWIPAYFAEVSKILAEYGAVSVAGSLDVKSLEGDTPPPGRIAVLSFPSLEAIDRFMADERYQVFKRTREKGSKTNIFVFENMVKQGELV